MGLNGEWQDPPPEYVQFMKGKRREMLAVLFGSAALAAGAVRRWNLLGSIRTPSTADTSIHR